MLPELLSRIPSEFETYLEPFVGGGALFFKLSALGNIRKTCLNDSNAELVNAYKVIKERPRGLIEELSSGKYRNEEETYYKIRAEQPEDKVKAAARFIYLNKTAYNGLHRVNSQGKFNAPFGRYEAPKIVDRENILAVSKALQKDEITCFDFEKAVSKAKNGDFVYFDPPYQPLSKTASFTQYTEKDFAEKDQQRLFNCFKRLDKKGCSLMLSNSYTPLVKELYNEYNLKVVMAGRAISCKGEGRGKIKEFLITNYDAYRPL